MGTFGLKKCENCNEVLCKIGDFVNGKCHFEGSVVDEAVLGRRKRQIRHKRNIWTPDPNPACIERAKSQAFAAIKLMDRDQDGKINWSEFYYHFIKNARTKLIRDTVYAEFQEKDLDHDGFLTFFEIGATYAGGCRHGQMGISIRNPILLQ